MNEDFWRSRWAANQIGFHQDDINAMLLRYEDRVPPSSRVLVPLSGKTRDMTYLAERGHQVVAVELVESALLAYFEERGVEPERRESDGAMVGGGVEAHARNIFEVTPDEVGTVDWIYDRAALIALRAEDRPRYVDHVVRLLRAGGVILLVALTYDQSRMNGPPFAVTPEEIETQFSRHGRVELLERTSILDDEPRFRQRGLDWLEESAWLVTVG